MPTSTRARACSSWTTAWACSSLRVWSGWAVSEHTMSCVQKGDQASSLTSTEGDDRARARCQGTAWSWRSRATWTRRRSTSPRCSTWTRPMPRRCASFRGRSSGRRTPPATQARASKRCSNAWGNCSLTFAQSTSTVRCASSAVPEDVSSKAAALAETAKLVWSGQFDAYGRAAARAAVCRRALTSRRCLGANARDADCWWPASLSRGSLWTCCRRSWSHRGRSSCTTRPPRYAPSRRLRKSFAGFSPSSEDGERRRARSRWRRSGSGCARKRAPST